MQNFFCALGRPDLKILQAWLGGNYFLVGIEGLASVSITVA